jgi:Na+/melibiose symporter-like transporter
MNSRPSETEPAQALQTPAEQQPDTAPLRLRARMAYGAFALPLAFVALPLYVHVPALYASTTSLTLAMIGVILLVTRLFDAIIDPLLGGLIDRNRKRFELPVVVLAGAALLSVGFTMLVIPNRDFPLAWLIGSLMVTYLGFSIAMIGHQSWGALLGNTPATRLAITSVREALGLVGVIIAAAMPVWLTARWGVGGWWGMSALFSLLLLLSCALLMRAPLPAPPATTTDSTTKTLPVIELWRSKRFRSLLIAFLLNGIAASLPSQLVVFFIEDVLQAKAMEGAFLACYFLAGALAMPAWTRLATRWGQCRTWMLSMALTVAGFIGALALGAGDTSAYFVICVVTGVALGADLAIPPALLASVIRANGHDGSEGRYFGVWSFATKLNLALAAGIALPLIAALGYQPGNQGPTTALTLTYCLLPCVFKLLAIAATWRFSRQHAVFDLPKAPA